MTTPNTFTDWPDLRSLATIPASIELLGTTGSNEPVRFLASLLAAQISAGEDGTSIRVAYRRTETTTRPPQPTGTRDVTTGVVTLAEPWVWDGPPVGTDPYIWASVANVPSDRSVNATFDTAFRLNAVDGAAGDHGDDGANGMGVQRIYREAVTTSPSPIPDAPTGGTRGNDGLLDTLPTGWSLTPPTTAGYKWAAYAGLPGLRTADPVYSAPFIYGGVDGTQMFLVFRWTSSATTQPTQPTAGTTTVNADGTALTSTGGSWYHTGNLPTRVEGQPYLWASIALRNPTTGNTTFGIPFRINGTDGTDGDMGAQGERGDDGRGFVILYYGNDDPDSGPTDPTSWRREADGTPDFNNPPSGWSTTVPSNRHIWIIVATVPADITAAIHFRSSIRITGLDGQDGAASAAGNSQRIIFTRSATAPTAPTGGTRNTDGSPNVLPTGWSLTVPTGTDPLYGSAMVIPGDRDDALTYSDPFILSGTPGARGAQGIDGYSTVPIFRQTATGTTVNSPTGGSYTGGVLTPPADWSLTEPADATGMETWHVFAVIAPNGTITYSIPRLPGADGADGAPGAAGRDGLDGNAVMVIFQRNTLVPPTPNADTGSYDLDTGVYTPPSGWSLEVPAGTNTLWGTYAQINIHGLRAGTAGSIQYSGVFTFGEALNITEIRNELASLMGSARLPASAIAGLNEHLDPRVDALERATVDLNAVPGRLLEDADTTDSLAIALTSNEDPAEIHNNRWSNNIVASGGEQSIWLRVPESANLNNNAPATIDLRNYLIQVTSPDESVVTQEISVSSFDIFATDTNDTYDYLRQGSNGSNIPVYAFQPTAHVRLRKYREGVDRHSVFTGIVAIPDIGTVRNTEREHGELRRNSSQELEMYTSGDHWRRVYPSDPVNQMDRMDLVAPGWGDARILNEHGRALSVSRSGTSVAARTNSYPTWLADPLAAAFDPSYFSRPATDGTVYALGERDSRNLTAPGGETVNGWYSNTAGLYLFDATVMLANSRRHLGDQPGQLWLDLMVSPSTTAIAPLPLKTLARGSVVTTSYYEPVELKLTATAGVKSGDRIFLVVHDAFGIIAWEYVQGDMRIWLNQELHNQHLNGWQHQFLPDYPEGVNRHYRSEHTERGYAQRSLTLYSRGQVEETAADSTQAHTDGIFTGTLGENTQASTTGFFVSNNPTLGVQASTQSLFTGTGSQYTVRLKRQLPAGRLPETPAGLENDHIGSSGNRWRFVISRAEVDGNGIDVEVMSQAAGDPFPGAGQIVILVDNDVPSLAWSDNADFRTAITELFDILDENGDEFPNGPPDGTTVNVPAVGANTSNIFSLTGGTDTTYPPLPTPITLTFRETFTSSTLQAAADAFADDRNHIGASGNNWDIAVVRSSDTSNILTSIVTQGATDPHPGYGRILIEVGNSIDFPRWQYSTGFRNTMRAIFQEDFDALISDDQVFIAPDAHASPDVRSIVEFSGGVDAPFTPAYYTAHLRREFQPSANATVNSELQRVLGSLDDDHDSVGESGNGWLINISRGTVTDNGGWAVGPAIGAVNRPNTGKGEIRITIDNSITHPRWGDNELVREYLEAVMYFSGTPSTGIPDEALFNAPVPNATHITATFVGGIDHAITQTEDQIGDDPGPPERVEPHVQASTEIRSDTYGTDEQAVRLTLVESVGSRDFSGFAGNNVSLRLRLSESATSGVDVINGHTYVELTLPISLFTTRKPRMNEFLDEVLFPLGLSHFTFEYQNNPTDTTDPNHNGGWDAPGFPALADLQSGDSVTYEFVGGLDGGDIVYTGAGFVTPNPNEPVWQHWHLSDPDPDSVHGLWIATALATQNSNLQWSYSNWNYFASGLGEHHTQYATGPNGPWSGDSRTTGYWRHRNQDGTWGPPIRLHAATRGEWQFLGRYILAQPGYPTYITLDTWNGPNGETVESRGFRQQLTHSFSLDAFDTLGFEFEFWQGAIHSQHNAHGLVMRTWGEYPVTDDWTTPVAGKEAWPDFNYTVAYFLRRDGGDNNVLNPEFFFGRPGQNTGLWFGVRHPPSVQRFYSSDDVRGGMINLHADNTTVTDRRFVDRFTFFNRVNNGAQLVRIWGKVR